MDILHIAGQTHHTVGGAGLYTALASARVGTVTTLFAPKPDPLPAEFVEAARRFTWLGPLTLLEDLPRLEIEHHGAGRATLIGAAWGAESALSPALVPADLSAYQFIHIAALSSAARQLEFLRACRERGATFISVGTYARLVSGETETVRTLFTESDVFFMNENEANGLLGESWREPEPASIGPRSGLYVVTLGEQGAMVFINRQANLVTGVTALELDPTGAGDTFCGSTLGLMAQGQGVLEAAAQAATLAASVIASIGPAVIM